MTKKVEKLIFYFNLHVFGHNFLKTINFVDR
jgi:hypothetical protein